MDYAAFYGDAQLREYLSQSIQNGAGADGVDEDIANVLTGNPTSAQQPVMMSAEL